MPKIDLKKYPKIRQKNLKYGCIPVNIVNVLHYYGEYRYNELDLLNFYFRTVGALGFNVAVPHLKALLPDFEFKFKGKIDFGNSIDNVIEYIKLNIDKKIPVLVSFKAWGNKLLWHSERGLKIRSKEKAHIRTAIEYNNYEVYFFDPGDGEIKSFNYKTNEFLENIKGDFHTLVIKRR